MTIKTYLDALDNCGAVDADGKSLSGKVSEVTHIWSNQACIGYLLLAMDKAKVLEGGMWDDLRTELVINMQEAFESTTVDDAAKLKYRPRGIK